MTGEGFLSAQEHVNNYDLQASMAYASYIGAMTALSVLGGVHLDNNTQQTEMMMPSGEDKDDMQRRQKLTIGGVTQWRSFGTLQELVDLVEAVNAGKIQPKKAHRTFREYSLDWYEKYKKPQLSEGHNANYQSMLNVHILPMIGEKDISEITVADVQAIMDTLNSASTGRQVKCVINMVMDAAIADELYHHPNPTKDKRINMPKEKKERAPVATDDISAIMNHLPNMKQQHAALLAMLIMTGARRGEVLGARWEDIDWTAKTIHLQRVVRYVNNRPVVSEQMKTKSANRTVSLWDSLMPYLGERQENGFIIHDQGEPLSERQYRNRWKAIMKELKSIGVERFTAHQLRHSYATIAANSGEIAPKVLQGMLGHANFTTTMNIYAGLDHEKILQSSSDLGASYAKISEKVAAKLQ